jgi:hypothetical protein
VDHQVAVAVAGEEAGVAQDGRVFAGGGGRDAGAAGEFGGGGAGSGRGQHDEAGPADQRGQALLGGRGGDGLTQRGIDQDGW